MVVFAQLLHFALDGCDLLRIGLFSVLELPPQGALFEAGRVAAQEDVDTTACHVCSDRHRTGPAGLRDDAGLALVLLRVQHFVRDALALEERAQLF